MNKQIKILILDGNTVQSVSVLKALRQAKMNITVFCENRISYGYTSRFSNRRIKCPSIKNEPDLFKDFFNKFLEHNLFDILLPLYDDSATWVNENRDKIELLGILVALPKKDLFMQASNKSWLMDFCLKNNIPHPRSITINKDNLEKSAEIIGFPSLIKPNNSSGALGIIYLNSLAELKKYFFVINSKYGNLSLQSYVNHSGYYYNVMIHRSKNGIFSQAVIIKIRRYFPIKGGTGSYSEVVTHKAIELMSKKILKKLNWNGFADLDFIVDKISSQPKLIEINPRIPSCIHAALVSGINFPEIIVCDNLGINIPDQKYTGNRKIRYLSMDVLWFFFSKQRFSVNPSWFNFFEKNIYYQDGSWNDFLPMLAGIFMGVKKYLNPSFRKSKLENN